MSSTKTRFSCVIGFAFASLLAGAAAAQEGPLLSAVPDSSGSPMQFDVGSRTGDPYANLPAGTVQISRFGERPAWSPDGKKLAFIGKSYGDAFEYDVATGAIRNLTSHYPHEGYLRVQYLPDRNLLLQGPDEPVTDRLRTRLSGVRLWFLDKTASRPAQYLDVSVLEGIAVSRRTNLIAWTPPQGPPGWTPEAKPDETRAVYTGVVTVGKSGRARMTEVKTAFRRKLSECTPEPQDFRDQDRELVHACYRLNSLINADRPTAEQKGTNSGVWGARLDSGSLVRYRRAMTGEYSEPEGISPDGAWTLVECGQTDASGLDICRLGLTPDSTDYRRLTHVLDYGRWKASNPVVSPDRHWVAFQSGRAFDEPGVGRGIFIMPLRPEDR
jgi:WD40 repeat protein